MAAAQRFESHADGDLSNNLLYLAFELLDELLVRLQSHQLKSFANSVHDQESDSHQATQTDDAVANPECHELGRFVSRLKCRQEAEHTECSHGQKKK